MMYRYKDSSGQTVYSDRPPSPGEARSSVDVIRNGAVVKSELAREENPHAQAKGYIKDARKHIPKALVYIEYIEYLRKHNPARYQAYMHELMTNDPKSYTTLVRAGLFRPLQPHQRLSNVMDAGVGLMDDLFAGRSGAGTALTFAEKTLVDYMKKDGFMPNVLGSPSTLPKVVPQYSNTRLGQWSKMEDAKMAKTGKELQAALAGRPVLNAAASAATRVGGPVLDAMIGALDPQMVPGVAATFGFEKYKKDLANRGISLDGEEELYLRQYLASGNWEAARNLIKEAILRTKK
jgi:hypothetical protein